MMLMPEEIKQIRERVGLSQEQMAERLGVRQATLSRWEAGERRPGGSALILLRQIAAEKRVLRDQRD